MELAQKKVEERAFDGTFGVELELKWGKGAELAPKKVAEGTFEAQVRPERAQGSHLEADFGSKLAPGAGQEGEVGAEIGQVSGAGAKESWRGHF